MAMYTGMCAQAIPQAIPYGMQAIPYGMQAIPYGMQAITFCLNTMS